MKSVKAGEVKNICVDPGHGGKDPGAVDHSIHEEDFNLIISSMVAAQLRQVMFSVVQTRAYDETKSLGDRCKIANDNNCNVFVSVHANAAEQDRAEGFEIFCMSDSGKLLATDILNSVQALIPGLKIRGIKKSRGLYVLKHTRMPAVLIECGFITNPEEAGFLKDEKSQVLMATAISQGILKHFKKGE